MTKLGLVSVSFRAYSPERIIDEAKKAGLSYIEWGSDIHAPCFDREKLIKIAEYQKQSGICCSSYGTYFRLGVTDINELISYIEAARLLGTDILRLWCGDKASEDYTEEEEKKLFEICKTAAEIAEENKVTLCMECHNGTFTDKKEAAIKLMKAVNSPCFRMYWQPNQFTDTEENMKYARLLCRFTKAVHVFNWSEDARFPLSDAVPLWKEYLSYFRKDTVLLLEFMPDDSIDSLITEAQSLRKIAE